MFKQGILSEGQDFRMQSNILLILKRKIIFLKLQHLKLLYIVNKFVIISGSKKYQT